MNGLIQNCAACGGNRVVAGELGYAEELFFKPAELTKERYWTTIERAPRTVTVLDPRSASICLDCGTLSTVLKVDVKKARHVLDKYGTKEVKARLAISPPAP